MEIKRAAKQVAREHAEKRPRGNRTLSLDYHRFEALSEYCRSEGLKVSGVVDRLIEAYLAEVGRQAK